MQSPAKPLAAVLALFLLATAPALAAEARASGNVPVRAGPGDGYAVIDRLSDGQYYGIEDCTRRARWCLLSEDGFELGWVRGSALVGAAAKVPVTPFEFLVNPRRQQLFGSP